MPNPGVWKCQNVRNPGFWKCTKSWIFEKSRFSKFRDFLRDARCHLIRSGFSPWWTDPILLSEVKLRLALQEPRFGSSTGPPHLLLPLLLKVGILRPLGNPETLKTWISLQFRAFWKTRIPGILEFPRIRILHFEHLDSGHLDILKTRILHFQTHFEKGEIPLNTPPPPPKGPGPAQGPGPGAAAPSPRLKMSNPGFQNVQMPGIQVFKM